jgi:hypothetical protein
LKEDGAFDSQKPGKDLNKQYQDILDHYIDWQEISTSKNLAGYFMYPMNHMFLT